MLTQLVHEPRHTAGTSRRAQLQAEYKLARSLWLNGSITTARSQSAPPPAHRYPTVAPRPVDPGAPTPAPPADTLFSVKLEQEQQEQPGAVLQADVGCPLSPDATVSGSTAVTMMAFVKVSPVSPVSPVFRSPVFRSPHGDRSARGRIRKDTARPTSPAAVRRKSATLSPAGPTVGQHGGRRPGRAPSPTRADLEKAVRLAAMKNAEIKRKPMRSISLSHTLLQRQLWFSLMNKLAEARHGFSRLGESISPLQASINHDHMYRSQITVVAGQVIPIKTTVEQPPAAGAPPPRTRAVGIREAMPPSRRGESTGPFSLSASAV